MNQYLYIREPNHSDEAIFLSMTAASLTLHQPWVTAPLNHEAFMAYLERLQQPNQKSYWLFKDPQTLLGVFNVNEIVRGCFQSAYLGFYANAAFAGQGYMSQGLKLVLKVVFEDLGLHRIEANIQPDNTQSIVLVQKNGFQKEGYSPRYLKINDVWKDHERWALTREDWKL